MVLTILSGVTLGLLGLFGLFRGVRRGLIAVAGTLLGAVLIDLWQARWSGWLRANLEQPAWITFLVTGAIFLLVALLVGYGGSLLLPRPDPKAKKPGISDGPLGALLGVLNGALIVSYLLRYANENWPQGEAATLIAESIITRTLDSWLPWFVLAMVVSTTLFVLLRGAMRLKRALNPPAPVPTPIMRDPVPAPGAGAPRKPTAPAPTLAPGAAPTAATTPAKNTAEVDRTILDKISQVTDKK
jgi:hypothetical protein